MNFFSGMDSFFSMNNRRNNKSVIIAAIKNTCNTCNTEFSNQTNLF